MNKVDQAVPTRLRPDDWAELCVNVAAAGWGVDAAAAELASVVPHARGKAYVAAVMKRMAHEGPRHDQGATQAPSRPLWRTSDRTHKIEAHVYEATPVCDYAGAADPDGRTHDDPSCHHTFCSRCALPRGNRVHVQAVVA